MSRKPRRRPVHYVAHGFPDGSVIACCPTRKPSNRKIKEDGMHIDEDLVLHEYNYSANEFGPWEDSQRIRTADLLANRLNMRRTVRELVLPALSRVEETLLALQERMQCIEQTLALLESRSRKHIVISCPRSRVLPHRIGSVVSDGPGIRLWLNQGVDARLRDSFSWPLSRDDARWQEPQSK